MDTVMATATDGVTDTADTVATEKATDTADMDTVTESTVSKVLARISFRRLSDDPQPLRDHVQGFPVSTRLPQGFELRFNRHCAGANSRYVSFFLFLQHRR